MVTTLLGMAAAALFPQGSAAEAPAQAPTKAKDAVFEVRAQSGVPIVDFVGQAPLSKDPALQKPVSITFTNGNLGDVLRTLSKNGLSFIVEETERARSARFTLSITNKPLSHVLEAIADVYGGIWSNKNGIYTLKQGGMVFGGATAIAPKGGMLANPKELKQWQGQIPPEAMKEIEEAMKMLGKGEMKELPDLEHYNPFMREPGAKNENPFDANELKKAIEEMIKGHKDWKQMESGKLSQKELEELHKELGQLHKELALPEGAMKFLMVPELEGKEREEMKQKIQEWVKKGGEGKFELRLEPGKPMPEGEWSVFVDGGGGNFPKLLDSLTPAQLELSKKQGYLTPKDLTDAQKKLLGKQPEGDWMISVSMNGKSLTIKSK